MYSDIDSVKYKKSDLCKTISFRKGNDLKEKKESNVFLGNKRNMSNNLQNDMFEYTGRVFVFHIFRVFFLPA